MARGYELGNDYAPPTNADLDVLGAHRLAPACLLVHAVNPRWVSDEDFPRCIDMALEGDWTASPAAEEWYEARNILAADKRLLDVLQIAGVKKTRIGDDGQLAGLPLAGVMISWQAAHGIDASFWVESGRVLSEQLAQYKSLGAAVSKLMNSDMQQFYSRIISLQGTRAQHSCADQGVAIINDPKQFNSIFDGRSQRYIRTPPIPASPSTALEVKPRQPSKRYTSSNVERLREVHIRQSTAEVSKYEFQPQIRDDIAAIGYDSLAIAVLLVLAQKPTTKLSIRDLRMSLIELSEHSITTNDVKYSYVLPSLKMLASTNMITFDEAGQQVMLTERGIGDGVPLAAALGDWMTRDSRPLEPMAVFEPKSGRLRFDLLNVLTASGGSITSALKAANVLGQQKMSRVYKQLATLSERGIITIRYTADGQKDIELVKVDPFLLPPLQRLMTGIQELHTEEGKTLWTGKASVLVASPHHFRQLVVKRFGTWPLATQSKTVGASDVIAQVEAGDDGPPFAGRPSTLMVDFEALGARPLAMASLLASFSRQKIWLESRHMLDELQRLSGDKDIQYPEVTTLHTLATRLAGEWKFCDQKPGKQNRLSVRINDAGIARALPLIGAVALWREQELPEHAEALLPLSSNKPSVLLKAYTVMSTCTELTSSKEFGVSGADHLVRMLVQRGIIDVEYDEKENVRSRRIIAIRVAEVFKDPMKNLVSCVDAIESEAERIKAAIEAHIIISAPERFARLIRF